MEKDKMHFKYRAQIFLLMAGVVGLLASVSAHAQLLDKVDTKEKNEFFVYKGDLVSLKVYSLTRIAVSNPGIVDIAKADVDELLLIGKTVGETSIFIWDEYGKRVITGRVFGEDLDAIIQRMQKMLDDAEIKGITLDKNLYEGKVVVKGRVPEEKNKIYSQIIGKFTNNVIELAKVEKNNDMIQIDAQVTELTTTLDKILGIDWSSGAEGIILPYSETIPTFDGSVGDFFKIGKFSRSTALMATVNALITEGKGRVLSKPSIVVVNGQNASFLVGGEIPIRTTTTNAAGGSVTENINFTSYGVDMTVTPTIRDDDKIEIILSVNVRDVDASNAVGGNTAFTTRTATTKLYLDDGQTIVLAGLIKHNRGETVTRIPFLSDVPILGLLFRSKSTSPNSDQEVVISLTPRIQRQKRPGDKTVEAKAAAAEGSVAGTVATGEAGADGQAAQPSESVDADQPSAAAAEEIPDAEAAKSEAPAATESGEGMPDDEETVGPPLDELAPAAQEEEQAAPGEEQKKETAGETKTAVTEMSSAKSAGGEAPDYDWTKGESSGAVAAYVQGIQKKIAERISYPYEAQEKGWDGTVKLTMTILSDGTLNDVIVKESSGHEVFDKDAVNTAKILAPFDPFPPEIDLEEIIVTIPIVYSQKNAAAESSTPASLPDDKN